MAPRIPLCSQSEISRLVIKILDIDAPPAMTFSVEADGSIHGEAAGRYNDSFTVNIQNNGTLTQNAHSSFWLEGNDSIKRENKFTVGTLEKIRGIIRHPENISPLQVYTRALSEARSAIRAGKPFNSSATLNAMDQCRKDAKITEAQWNRDQTEIEQAVRKKVYKEILAGPDWSEPAYVIASSVSGFESALMREKFSPQEQDELKRAVNDYKQLVLDRMIRDFLDSKGEKGVLSTKSDFNQALTELLGIANFLRSTSSENPRLFLNPDDEKRIVEIFSSFLKLEFQRVVLSALENNLSDSDITTWIAQRQKLNEALDGFEIFMSPEFEEMNDFLLQMDKMNQLKGCFDAADQGSECSFLDRVFSSDSPACVNEDFLKTMKREKAIGVLIDLGLPMFLRPEFVIEQEPVILARALASSLEVGQEDLFEKLKAITVLLPSVDAQEINQIGEGNVFEDRRK